MMTASESTCVRKDPCPSCDSSDACAVYDDGHAHCFSCGDHFPRYEEGEKVAEQVKEPNRADGLLSVTYVELKKRNVTRAVCRTNGYGVATYRGDQVQVAEYCDASGDVVAQKVKTPAKDFVILGDAKAMTLWPMHRFKSGGKRLLITEGETDLLCWQTLQGDRWPAVSIPNGAPAARKAIGKCINFVESFDEVVICFDSDEPGRLAAQQVCEMLTPGKARIMSVPKGCKDICEAVQKGESESLVRAFWEAEVQRPDGIIGGEGLLEALMTPPQQGHSYPWPGLTRMTMGLRPRELVTLTAGTGVGKSSVAGLIAHHLITEEHLKIGYISLEESLTRTVERLVGAEIQKHLHVSREGVSEELLTETWKRTFDQRVVVFNHFGTMDAETLMQRVRFMRIAEGVNYIFLDHLSILVSGWGDGDERRLIDNVMTTLRSIVEQTGVGMVLISHLRSPTGGEKSHEEGARPKLNQLRGSKSISQLSDAVIAIQRDQQGDDKHTSQVWVLKNRFTGVTGRACDLTYDPETGLMSESGDNYGFEGGNDAVPF